MQCRAKPRATIGSTSARSGIRPSPTVHKLKVCVGSRIRCTASRHSIDPPVPSVAGSCNNAPIGLIPSVDNIPSAKFMFPTNFGTVPKNQSFTVQVAIRHLETGWFTNPMNTYMSSPQVVNAAGDVIGHSHIVIERLADGFNQTTPTDPTKFEVFQGLNAPAVNGVLAWEVTPGLDSGHYRIAVIHTGANHQPST